MLIQWLGHSCFKVIEGNSSLIFDPFADGAVKGVRNIREEANVCLCSHMHGDHNAVNNVTLLEDKEDIFEIESINTFHDDQKGKLRGENIIHIVTVDHYYKIAHMGDLGCDLTKEQIELLKDCDVLMIPVGGYFTIDGKQAADIVKTLNPKAAIPMHYKSATFGYEVLGTVDQFTKYFENVLYLTTNTLEFSDELAGEIVVLDY